MADSPSPAPDDITRRLPDRYGDAVRARRAELRSELGVLSGTHRAELRAELSLARIAATDAATAAFAGLAREVRRYVVHGAPTVRRSLATRLPGALDALAERVHATAFAGLAPTLRRIATVRRLDIGPGWPTVPSPRLPLLDRAPPEPLRPPRLTGAAEGLAVWRVALVVVAAMPLVGLPVVGGAGLAPLAAGLGAAGVAVAVRQRRSGVERAVAARQAEALLARGRAALRVDVERMLLELERAAAAELDAAVERRRGSVEAELLALAGPRAVARV